MRAPPPSGACCVGLWPPSWWGVLCWCLAPLLLGRAVSVPACRGGGVWFGLSSSVGRVVVAVVLLAWPGLVLCWCMPPPPLFGRAVFVRAPPPWWGVLCRRVRVSVRGVVAGWMPGWFCWCAVVSATVRPALSGVGCLWCLPRRGQCCAGPRPPSWLGVLCWCVPPPLVGRAVSLCAPPHGGACCVGLWSPSCRGVLCWCVPPSLLGVLCRCVPPPRGGACCVGLWSPSWWGLLCSCVPPSWWGMLCWRLPAPVVVCGLGCRHLLGGLWLRLCCRLGQGWCCAGACPLPCWGVRCLCVAPPLLGRAVSACSGFSSWCCSRLDARLVLLVRCCLRRHTAGVVGCWLSVVFAWPGLVLCWCVPLPLVGRAALVCGPPHGAACSVGAWSPLAGACRVGASLPRWWCLVWVVVVRWPGCGCGCVVGLARVRVVLVRAPSPVGACRVCACPPPLLGRAVSACSGFGSWCCSRLDAWLVLLVRCCLRHRTGGVVGCWLSVVFAWLGLVLCWCVPPPLVGRAALVCGPPHGGACCVGLWSPSWWGLLCSCVPPSWWGMLCWRLPAPVVVCGLGCRHLLGGLWLRLCCRLGQGWCCAGACPLPCWGVRCLCVAPPLLGRAVSACSGFSSWCCSRLDARLVLLVRCCLRRHTAGVVGCWLSVVFAWPGLVLCWCVPLPLVGRAALVCGPPHGAACSVGAWSPLAGACRVGASLPRWWCLVWVVVVRWPGCGCGCVVGLARVRVVLVRAPSPVGACRVCACPPPPAGACCVGVFGFRFVVL